MLQASGHSNRNHSPLDDNDLQPLDPHVLNVIEDDKCEPITPDILPMPFYIGRKVALGFYLSQMVGLFNGGKGTDC